jgi:4'-phosphopantetheinyl transferase EntD
MLQGLPGSRRTALAATLFSAKEAYYKCRYQVSREPLGFHDVEIELAGEAFQVRATHAALRDRRVHVPATGCFEVRGDWVVVGVVARSPEAPPAFDGALRSRLQ